jgi:hypothetical protein
MAHSPATGWMVWRSNPFGGEVFHNRPDRPRGLPSLLSNGYQVFRVNVYIGCFLQYLLHQLPEDSGMKLIHVRGLVNYMTAYLAREFVSLINNKSKLKRLK